MFDCLPAAEGGDALSRSFARSLADAPVSSRMYRPFVTTVLGPSFLLVLYQEGAIEESLFCPVAGSIQL